MNTEATAETWLWLWGNRTVSFTETRCLLENDTMKAQGAEKQRRVDPVTPEMESHSLTTFPLPAILLSENPQQSSFS